MSSNKLNDMMKNENPTLENGSRWMYLLPIVIIAIIAFAFFYPADSEGLVLRQHDVQQGIAIGQEVKAFTEATGETSRWTNSLFSGMPNFQISPSYESSKPIALIGKIVSLGLPSPANLLFVMMFGFYILMLSFGAKWHMGLLGAIAYGFSTYFVIIIGAGHIWKFIALSYVAPTIAGIVWAYRGKYLLGATVTAISAALQIAGNHVQMTYYFMFVIVALVIAYGVEAYRGKQMKRWGIASGALAVAAIAAIAANSPNLYNTYQYSKESMRGGHSELASAQTTQNATDGGLNKDYITAWSYGIDETLSLVVPNVNGGANIKPMKGSNTALVLQQLDAAEKMYNAGEISGEEYQALGSFYQYFGDQPSTNGPVYVGAIIFALFLLGCFVVKGPVKWALVAVTLLSIALSWGHNMMWFTDLFIDHFPLYNKFRTVSSILVIAEFTMPLLAILALKKIAETPEPFNKFRTEFYMAFGISALICVVLWLAPSIFLGDAFSIDENEAYIKAGYTQMYPSLFKAVETLRYGMVKADALRSLMLIAAAAALLLLYNYGKIKTLHLSLILVFLVLIDMYSVNKRYLSYDSFTRPMEQTQFAMRPVDKIIKQDTAMNYRVLDIPNFTAAMPSYFHKCVGGYHAAKLSRYQDLMSRHLVISQQGVNINPRVMDMLNTRYVVFNDTIVERNPTALGNAWLVDKIEYVDGAQAEIDSLAIFNPMTTAISDRKFAATLGESIPAKVPGDTIYEITYAPNRLRYHAESQNGGMAVFSEVYFPWGWNVSIDGNPVEMGRVNYVLRALKIPAGAHTIEFHFDPQSVRVTETIAYIAVALIYLSLLALVVLAVVRYRKTRNKEA
ncbi:MAG: hypothetical protein ACI4BC_05505 [Muribaculaceae bacterium]